MNQGGADKKADRLRVGMVGGGRGALIGVVHRMALGLDNEMVLVAGALSSNPEIARASSADIGLDPERSYDDFHVMARAEAAREDGIQAVIIVTPNHLHARVAKEFLSVGIDVICDKPLSVSLEEAEELAEITRRTGLVFALTLNNTGYAMVRQARQMVEAGALGDLRIIRAEYVQDWLSLLRRRARNRLNGAPIQPDQEDRLVWPTLASMRIH